MNEDNRKVDEKEMQWLMEYNGDKEIEILTYLCEKYQLNLIRNECSLQITRDVKKDIFQMYMTYIDDNGQDKKMKIRIETTEGKK